MSLLTYGDRGGERRPGGEYRGCELNPGEIAEVEFFDPTGKAVTVIAGWCGIHRPNLPNSAQLDKVY